MKKRKKSLFLGLIAFMAAFLLILAAFATYKYHRMKGNLAQLVISSLNDKEAERVEELIKNIESSLLTVKDMGENGLLSLDSPKNLEKKLRPLIENQDVFHGAILADTSGCSFHIFRKGKVWTTKLCKPAKTGSTCQEMRLQGRKIISTKQIHQPDWNPATRPWFKGALESKGTYWTGIYSFFSTKEPGITASVAWEPKASKGVKTVFALDIPVSAIQSFLLKKGQKKLFLVIPHQSTIISSDKIFAMNKELDRCKEDVVCNLALSYLKQKTKGPLPKVLSTTFQKERWFFCMKPIRENGAKVFLGVAVPESELVSGLEEKILKPDPTDLLVALLGGVALFFLLFKTGIIQKNDGKEREPAIARLTKYLSKGEGQDIEFKSTVRTNLRTGKPGKEIELSWLKAVVAFLNSTGGALLLGVDDSGKIKGIEADGFENQDKCLLHIKNLLNAHIGAEFSGFIHTEAIEIESKTVVMVECAPSKEPVFLKIGKNEEFYVRSGPSSLKLTPSQTVNYVLARKSKKS